MRSGYNPSKFTQALDKAIGVVAPRAALNRKRARVLDFLTSYEGAKPGRLRNTPAPKLESHDANNNGMGRSRIMAEARDLEDNVGLVLGINRMFAKYVVGSLRAQSRTGDEEHDNLYEDYFSAWSKAADITGRHSFTRIAQLAVMGAKRDGDMGFVKARDSFGLPRLQAIEGDRIGSPYQVAMSENYIQGVVIDSIGAPSAYRIYNRSTNGSGFTLNREILAKDFIHLLNPTRFDQYRGVSAYHTAVNSLRDVKEILEFEKIGVKWSSSQAAVITKQNGAIGSDVPLIDEVNSDGETDKLETFAAGVVNYLAPGEDIKAFTSDRPSAAFSGFLQMLLRDIALGLELPYEFVWDMSGLGGVPSRFISQQAKRTFDNDQALLKESFLDPVWCWVIADGIMRGELPENPLFYKVSWQFPAHPTVDVGRESQANLNENRQGLKSAASIYGEQGQDWQEEQEQCAKEAANIKRLALKYGVDTQEIRMLTPNGNPLAAQEAPPEPVKTKPKK